MSRDSLSRDVAWTALGYAVPMGLSFVSSIMLARLLGPDGRGELQAIQVLPQLVAIAAGFGLPHAVTYFTAREPDRSGEHLGSAIAATLSLGIPLAVVVALSQPAFLHEYRGETLRAGILFAAFVPLNGLIAVPWSTVFAHRRFKLWNVVRMLPQILYALVIFTAVATGWARPAGIAVAYLAAFAIVAGPASWLAYRRVTDQRVRVTRRSLQALGRYGGLALLSQAPGVFNARFDQAFIAAILPAHDLGLYAVAVSWSSLQVLALNVVAANLLPRLPGAPPEQVPRLVSNGIRWGAMLALVTSVGLLAATRLLFARLFGAGFAPAVSVTMVLVVAGAVMAFNQVLSDCCRGMGHPGATAVAEIAGAVVTALGLSLFLRGYGIMAAAVVSLSSYILSTLFLFVAIARVVPSLGTSLRDGVANDVRNVRRFYRNRFAAE